MLRDQDSTMWALPPESTRSNPQSTSQWLNITATVVVVVPFLRDERQRIIYEGSSRGLGCVSRRGMVFQF